MKFIKAITFIIILSIRSAIAQQYEGYIYESGGGKNATEFGISGTDIDLIVKGDTLRTVTNSVGYFYFNNIKDNKVRLISSKRHCTKVDTTLEIKAKNNIDTFYSMYTGGKRELKICYNGNTANEDILKLQMVILLPGGIAGTEVLNKDTIFENRYNIEYLSLGCVRAGCTNEWEYNTVIFKYLDKKFGTKWRAEIRKESIGFVN